MTLDEQKAKKAGKLGEYQHHLGMVAHPMSFPEWDEKMERLMGMLNSDPDGRNRFLDQRIKQLSEELGV